MFTKVHTSFSGHSEEINAIAKNADDQLFVIGDFSSSFVIADDTLTLSGSDNFFLAKCDPVTGFLWAIAPDCSISAFGKTIAIDDMGFIYISGNFRGNLNFGNNVQVNSTYYTTFIAKYSSSGDIIWAKAFETSDHNTPCTVIANSNGNIYLAGHFSKQLVIDGHNLYSWAMANYILKADGNGNTIWITQSTGDGDCLASSLGFDSYGNLILAGTFHDEVTFGNYTLPGLSPGHASYDNYVCKMSADGAFLWAVQFGGYGSDDCRSVSCGKEGSIYITGMYEQVAYFGPYQLDTGVGQYYQDTYVAKMSSVGNFEWVKSIDVKVNTNNLMCVDSKDNLYITSSFSGAIEVGPSSLSSRGYTDLYILKMDKEGQILYAKEAGSQISDEGTGIVFLENGDLAVTGYVASNAVFDSIQIPGNSGTAFIAIINQSGPIQVNEIKYQSASSSNTGDWVEILNSGDDSIDLANWSLKDGNEYNIYTISSPAILAPGQYLVLCQNLDNFRLNHPDILNSQGSFDFDLAANGEKIRLFDKNGLLISQVYYKAISPWPDLSDGCGKTLELLDTNGELADGNNWFAGCLGGSPGRAYFDCASAGRDDLGSNIGLAIFPNPVNDMMFISFISPNKAEIEVAVYDQKGLVVKREIFGQINPGNNILYLSVADFSEGLYFLQLITSGNSYHSKFIVR
jgi:hypothetical protein